VPLRVFGCKIVHLGLYLLGPYVLPSSETKEPCQGGMISVQVKFVWIEVFMEMF
jgi:hypothetical protein